MFLERLLGNFGDEELRPLLSKVYFQEAALDGEVHACDEGAAATLLHTGRVVHASFLWSTVARRSDLHGSFWIPGEDRIPPLRMVFWANELEKKAADLGELQWRNSNFIQTAQRIWMSGEKTAPSWCSDQSHPEAGIEAMSLSFKSVRPVSLHSQLVAFEGIMVDQTDMVAHSHVRLGLFDLDRARRHPFFGPFMTGRAKYRDLLWADLSDRLASGDPTVTTGLATDTRILQEGLDGQENEHYFRCPGSAGLWRRGLLEVEVISSLAMVSHLWVLNYAHWFAAELPAMIVLAPWLLADTSRKIIVHPLPRALEALSMLGVAPQQVLVLDSCKLYFAKELKTVAGLLNDRPSGETLTAIRRVFYPIVFRRLETYRDRNGLPIILISDKRDGRPRTFGSALRAAMAEQIFALCRGRCEVQHMVQSADMPFIEQATSFARASVVFTPQGGVFANILWLSQGDIAIMVYGGYRRTQRRGKCGLHHASDLAFHVNVTFWTFVAKQSNKADAPNESSPTNLQHSDYIWADFVNFLKRLFKTRAMISILERNSMTKGGT